MPTRISARTLSSRTILAATGAGLIGTLAASVGGAVTYVSASRSVTASVSGTTQSFSSMDLGPYSRTASVTLNDPFPPGSQTASASASITSDLLAEVVVYSLSGGAFDGVSASSGFGAGSAVANMMVRFTLDVPTPYTLVGGFPSAAGFSANASEQLTLVGGGTIFLHRLNTVVGGPPFVNLSGLLEPGTYDFVVSAGGSTIATGSGTSSASGSINRQLLIPTPTTASAAALALLGLAGPRRRTMR